MQKNKNPPEAGSLNMVPEPEQKCREHFYIARQRDPEGEPLEVASISNLR